MQLLALEEYRLKSCTAKNHIEMVYIDLQQESIKIGGIIKNLHITIAELEQRRAQSDTFLYLESVLSRFIEIVEEIPKISFPIPVANFSESLKYILDSRSFLESLSFNSSSFIILLYRR